MDVKIHYKKLEQMVNNQDWAGLDLLNGDIKQKYINSNDINGLKEFYDELLSNSMTHEEYQNIKISNAIEYENNIYQIFLDLKDKIGNMKNLKALYLEYFYDGGDSCTADLFLCDDYSSENDYWGAEFGEYGMIEGPSIFKYFTNGCDFEMSPVKDTIMYAYIDAILLVSTLNAWEKASINGFPLAFALHDNRMVRLENK